MAMKPWGLFATQMALNKEMGQNWISLSIYIYIKEQRIKLNPQLPEHNIVFYAEVRAIRE